ncbi:N-acetylneuraminate lyase B-like isoform X2 [Cylas formicarius]|uniref:N-acetylneuraminate lyase B-like isoform X2 n=1 Tax=Cylas formicarius TaxID=197179 RepID=UPI002958B618|nr:N-acetylneuraminate lyase B-like isoform X2 [Cylas formicarius]
MRTYDFRGIMVPVLTAFHDDMSLNLDAIPRYADYLAQCGIQGILITGTIGEGMNMKLDERKTLIEAWAKTVKATHQHLMVQVGGTCLSNVLELARHAESCGADSLLCLPEIYYKPKTIKEIVAYFKLVSASAPQTPLFYYNSPARTGVNVNILDFLKEAEGQIPTLRGVKFVDDTFNRAYDVLKAVDGKYAIFITNNTLVYGGALLGFDSFMAPVLNLVPKLGIDLLKAVHESDLDKARNLQGVLTKIANIILKTDAYVPRLKAAANFVLPIKLGSVRSPLEALGDEDLQILLDELKPYISI